MSAPARVLRLGTRRSLLARTQSGGVARALAGHGHPTDLVDVVTEGDRSSAALTAIGGSGVFVTELRRRLLDGDIDLAVHSLKDLPTGAADGLVIAAVPVREDPRDALVARDGLTLESLPSGARVGTGSPRRAAQLRRARPDLAVQPLRGNVDTRLRAVSEGTLDAVVLAMAGLVRLGRQAEVTEVLDPAVVLPAPGQGALAVECRADDAELVAAVGALDDQVSRTCTTAERATLAALEAGCLAPVGALAQPEGDQLVLTAAVVATDGSHALRRTARLSLGDDAVGPAHRLAADLLAAGAADLIGENP